MKTDFFKTAHCLCLLLLCVACKEDKLSSEAEILYSFWVTNEAGRAYDGVIGDDNIITIKISPYLDIAAELATAKPSFYISRGATVAPDPSLPQNFAQDGGVKYTVTAEDGSTRREYTVTIGEANKLPYGAGFSHAQVGVQKTFDLLGYPGEQGNLSLPDGKLYGDLYMYHAYCGNYIVLLSRRYILDDGPSSPHGVKVVDKNTLAAAGISLNLGSINVADLKMITSDYKGRCVGAVVTGSSTEFFYWTTPTATPVSVGTVAVNMAPFNTLSDGSSNFQVAGDITGNAWITALASHVSTGNHYRIKVTGGRLASDYSIIQTGYRGDNGNWFQMISPLDDSDEPDYVIGDAEPPANTANSTRCYINSYAGVTITTMPGLWNNILQPWGAGTGYSVSRTGGHRPVVSGMVINGKSYVVVQTGTSWRQAAAVLERDLTTLAHTNLNITYTIDANWCYGGRVDWYWNEEETEAYIAMWFGRIGLSTYKLTCFE
ncbi:MAG: DUF5018 domain-containing protein [Prevotellaceae bacterium]|jgi:hypothetical protein|nr:DUF5018 domain-containing protein [Prevotellaceae bacterium]